VNVAEDVRDALAIEEYGALCVPLVKSKVEALTVEKREHIVKEGVEVRKLDVTASGYDKDMWTELLVLLHQSELLAFLNSRLRIFLSRGKPDDDICGGGVCACSLLLLVSDMDAKRNLGIL
jgi:hypothetical protein